MSSEHVQKVFELEKGDKVVLKFTGGDKETAEVVSPYSTGRGEVLFDLEGYENVLSVEGGVHHGAAVIRGGKESFGFVEEVEFLD